MFELHDQIGIVVYRLINERSEIYSSPTQAEVSLTHLVS